MDLNELDKKFEKLLKEFPQSRTSLVENAGEKMYQKVINNITTSVKEDSGNLKAGVMKVIGSGRGYAAVRPNWKKAPHTDLIENGHRIVRGGKIVGWVAGKHMYRNALNELADDLEKDAGKMLYDLVGDIFD